MDALKIITDEILAEYMAKPALTKSKATVARIKEQTAVIDIAIEAKAGSFKNVKQLIDAFKAELKDTDQRLAVQIKEARTAKSEAE